MITEELLNFVTQEKQNGLSNETIRRALRKSKWSEDDIERVIKATGEELRPNSYAPTKKENKQVFVVLLLIIIYPIGLFLMWLYMEHWRRRVKYAISIFLGLVTILFLVISPLNPFYKNQIKMIENSILYKTYGITEFLTNNFPTVDQLLNPTKLTKNPIFSFTSVDEKRLEIGLSAQSPDGYLPILAPSLRAVIDSESTSLSGGLFPEGSTVSLMPNTLDLRDNGKNVFGNIQATVTTDVKSSKVLIGLIKENGVWYVTFETALGK